MEYLKNLLFVYGTLRTEYTKVGKRVASDRAQGFMFDLGGCPGCLFMDGENQIVGEVLEIETKYLPLLDKYEGVSNGLYSRIEIKTEEGHECFTYQINPQMVEQGAIWVKSGDWLNKGEDNPVVAVQIEEKSLD